MMCHCSRCRTITALAAELCAAYGPHPLVMFYAATLWLRRGAA